MHEFPSSLDCFLRRVYRRLVVLRLAEWAGLGFAAGCATALISILVLRNQNESTLVIAAAQMVLGMAVGFIAALLRRPRMIEAAVQADRQLKLADLLATAWQLERNPQRESFEEAVLLVANGKASQLQPRLVLLHRLGMRAWSGIGLAGALVLTVAILTANPIDTEAASSPFGPQKATNKSQQDQKASRANSDVAFAPRPAAISPDHPGGEDDPLPGAGKTTDSATNAARGQNTDVQASNPNGAGAGAGKSAPTPDKANPFASGTNSSRTNTAGKAASGVGNSSEKGNAGNGNSSASVGNSSKSSIAPAWQSDSWPAAQQAADAAISSGQVPPAYHDLVREYFKR
jgi:hypothetical protein